MTGKFLIAFALVAITVSIHAVGLAVLLVEGLTGILMCGLSAGIFFAVVSKIISACMEVKRK